MNTNFYANAYKQAEKLHANAKNGTLKVNGVAYEFSFDSYEGVYVVTANGETITRFNTRKLTDARKWLRDYLAN